MKRILLLALTMAAAAAGHAQITITAADMPVAGDTLRYSMASPTGSGIVLSDSGPSHTWNFTFTPTGQAVDTYKTTIEVNPIYALTIGATAYGFRTELPIPVPLPGITVTDIYTFFEKRTSPDRFQAQAFAANVSGLPTPVNYSKPDVWYFFPLAFGDMDTASYRLAISLPGLGSLKQQGMRRTNVDGWGTVTTPFYTTPTPCIRVRHEIHEIDSVQFGSFPTIGIPRDMTEYKWMVNGDHYPAVWVVATIAPGGGGETINSVRYRDGGKIDNAVPVVNNTVTAIKAYPNPAADGMVSLELPAGWNTFTVDVYDVNGALAAQLHNEATLNLAALPAGNYLLRVTSGTGTGYAQVTR